ncbi:YggU family protein [Candidatus Woesearchaeota archaeon]|nr:YggU family protein [Candidatus Woesearchaeota archaeon]
MQILSIKVKPNARKTEIKEIKENVYHINIKAPAEDNKANLELIKFLSKHFKKEVKIISGFTSKNKLIKLLP